MASGPAPDVTQLLVNWSRGDQAALEQLMPLVYGELRRLAAAYLRRERSNHTLQSTALVNEAFLRMVQQHEVQWRNRAHFYGIAAQMIRRILVDYARSQHAEKRGSGVENLALSDVRERELPQNRAALDLDDALHELEKSDPLKAQLIEMRYFGGMTAEETALAVGKSVHIVRRELRLAQAWLRQEMAGRRFKVEDQEAAAS